ncbi:MAG: sugar phosphate isomerase/epimerase family protein, partial [Planctomycetota bacterium]
MSSKEKSLISRRCLLATSAAAAAALAAGVHGAPQDRQRTARTTKRGPRRGPVGLQLYSVRGDCKRDLPGTIVAVGKMGYKGVEFAGYYDHTAKQLRKMLDDNGLKCCGTHTGLATLLGDNLPKTIAFNKTLGNKYLVVPGLPGKYR